MTATASWSSSTADRVGLRLLVYVPVGLLEGFGLLVLVGLGVSLARATLLDPGVLVLALLFVLVGGPLSLLYLWPMLRDPDQRPGLSEWEPILAGIRPSMVVAAGVVGAAYWVVAFETAPRLAFGVAAVIGGLSLVLVSLLISTGRVEPDRRRLVVDGRTVDLDRLDGVSCVRLADWALFVPRFRRRWPPLGTPWIVAVPASAAPEVQRAIEAAIVAQSPTPSESRGEAERTDTGEGTGDAEPDRFVQGVLGLAAVAFLGLGVGVFTIDHPGMAGVFRLYLVGVCGLLGLLFAIGAVRYA